MSENLLEQTRGTVVVDGEDRRLRPHSFAASRVTLVYAVAATAWILLSDLVLGSMVSGRLVAERLGLAKGLAFVVVTSLLLHVVLRRRRVIAHSALGALDRRASDADRIEDALFTRVPRRAGIDLLQAHNALAESESRLRLTINAAAEAIITTEENGMVLTWNREAERIFGRTEEEAVGEEICASILPARGQKRCRSLLRMPSRESPPRRVELTGARADGSEFPMELSVIPIEWGERTLHTAFIRDISDRFRAAREAEYVAAIVDASADAIFALTADGTIASWNPAAERVFGFDAEAAKSSPLSRLFSSDATTTVRWLLDSIALGISIEAAPLECARRGTETFKALVSVSPLHEGSTVRGAAVVIRDASAQLMARDRVKDAEILASLGRLAAATGHQFNNVLMGIQPFVDVLKRQDLPPAAARAVQQIAKSVERGRRVTTEIQDFTRASAAPMLRTVPLSKWLGDLRGEIELALGPEIDLHTYIDERDIALTADAVKLKQVFMNLAVHARNAMPDGGRFTIAVRDSPSPPPHATASESSWVEILLRDTSEGLDEESQRRIFEPLYAKKRGGSGLELATVQQIVRSHGGAIDVSSEPGTGTEFRIFLPRAAATLLESAENAHSTARAKPRRVLLVEDDTNIASGLSQALGEHGMQVDVVHTGARVLGALQTFAPELVVLDVFLPDANGFDVYREIAHVRPDLPVIFSTGHAGQLDLEAAEPLRLPHVELLQKPYTIETLLEAMNRVIANRG